MLYRILSQAEEVWPRDRVTMLPIPNMVRGSHDDGPGTGGCASNDGLICHIICNDLELGSITTIKDSAIVDRFGIGIARREVAPKNVT
jgi:hypothetical protein